jgi:DNA-binding transcriptional MerR regulator
MLFFQSAWITTISLPKAAPDEEINMQQRQHGRGGLEVLVIDPQEDAAEGIYRIGDLAREFDVTLRTLRFYEDRKLLIPARSGSTRLYSAEHRQRLKLILLAKRVGFSLTEIEEILEVNDRETLSKEALNHLLRKFKGQISVLQEQKAETDKALRELHEAISYLDDQL